MNSFLLRFGILPLVLLTISCSTMDTVANAPISSGVSKVYNYDYELIKAATLASVQGMNVNIKKSSETAEGFTINFSKSVSAFSWGEVGRVLVVNVDKEKSQVKVYSEKRSQFQVTGADTDDFANAIFEGIDKALADQQ